ncbi:MAG: type II toxin-antitoxin system RelE/ParE family toxin [Lachnospiraceae bacterium]|nr:type II toxin-antitoxin system RelE/ParE family toxin [Lachnospiraceae bacterium]
MANVSKPAAERLIDDFYDAANGLTTMPERCPWLDHPALAYRKYRKLIFGTYYMALFEICGGDVFITAVVDCRRDYGWMFR